MSELRNTETENSASPNGETERFLETRGAVLNDGLGSRWKVWKRRRYFVVLMAFLGEVTKEALRTNLSVAVFPMTENHSVVDTNGSATHAQDFDWDVKTRGFLLSVFFYGFVATHVIGGILAVRFGGTRLYGLGVLLTAIFTLLTPAAAHVHFYLLVALRILEGMGEGVLRPSLELLYARWIPMEERSTCVALALTGTSWGAMIGMAVSSAIAHRWGWPAIFYFTGAFGVSWFAVWVTIVRDSPKLDSKITATERTYIERSLEEVLPSNAKVSSIPYAKILTSIPLLATVMAYLPMYGCMIMLTTQLPAYFNDVLKLDFQTSGYISSLPFLFKMLLMYCSSPVADCLINRSILTATVTRKTFICLFLVFMAVSSFLIQHTSSIVATVACLTALTVSDGSSAVQIFVNILDLAPRYSSVLSGIVYTVGAAFGMAIPVAVGYLTQNKTAEEWHRVFSIQAGICLLTSAIYGVFGSGRLQPWATEKDRATLDEDE